MNKVRITFLLFFLAFNFSLFTQAKLKDSANLPFQSKIDSMLGNNLKGKEIPEFVIKDKIGRIVATDDLRSKILVINFWFEACPPCLAEFRALEKFYNTNKSRKDFQFISITFESDSVIEKVQKSTI